MEITSILKLISLLLAAGFAILGTTVDYKKEGQVTKWGRIAIIGVIVSGLLSSILLGMEETNKAAAQKKAAAEKVRAEEKANEEKAELNNQFQNLVTKAEDNIGKTEETLGKTNEVAQDVQQSVTDQKNLMAQTQTISGGVDKTVVQQQKTFQKTQDLQKQQGAVLQNTLRVLNSFKQFKVNYVMIFPTEMPKFQHFLTNLKTYALTHPLKENESELRASGNMVILSPNGEDGKEMLYLVSMWTDSPYFSKIKETEDEDIANILTKSLLEMYFVKVKPRSADGFDLKIQTGAWGRTEDLEKEIPQDSAKSPFNSQFFKIVVNYVENPRSGNSEKGIYITASTNIITEWEDENHKIQSFADLPDTEMSIMIPCGAKFKFFDLKTGDNYGTTYSLPGMQFKYESDRNGRCYASYVFTKWDFGFL